MGRPLITLRNAPVQELLEDQESVYLVEPADPQGLADAIRILASDWDLRDRLGSAGYARFLAHCSTERLGSALEGLLLEAMSMRAT